MVPRRLDIEIVAVEAKFKAAERRRKAKNKLRRKNPPTSPDDLDDRTLLPDKDPVSGTLGEVREPQTIPGGEKAAPPSCDEEPTDAAPSGRDEELPGDSQLPLPIQVSGPDRPGVGVPEVEGEQTTESSEIIVSSPVKEKTAVATNIGERFENPNITQFESTESVLKRVDFASEKDRTDFFVAVDKATIACYPTLDM